jgi:hypothetical protein
MTLQAPSPIVQVLPETAPFSEEQRSWLNGFFAGLLSLDNAGVTALSPAENAAVMGEADDGAPWHDPAMEMPERMKLADGKPLPRKLFCCHGAAGLRPVRLCLRDLFRGDRLRAGAAPEPLRARRQGHAAHAEDAGGGGRCRSRRADGGSPASRARRPGRPLTRKPGHGDLPLAPQAQWRGLGEGDLACRVRSLGCGLDYIVGDAFGIVAQNDPRLADAVIALLGARPDALVNGKTLREVLISDVALGPAPDALFQLISYVTGGETRAKAKRLAAGEDPDGDLDRLDVLGTLHKFGRRSSRRRPSSRRSIRCSRGFIRSRPRTTPRPACHADRRHGALQGRHAPALGRRLDLSRRARPARRQGAGLCPAGAWFRRCRKIRRRRSSCAGPAPASRRSAPSCTTARPPRRRAETGCSSAISAGPRISSTRTN